MHSSKCGRGGSASIISGAKVRAGLGGGKPHRSVGIDSKAVKGSRLAASLNDVALQRREGSILTL